MNLSSPTHPRLLGMNVNRGVNVKLRLRRVNQDDVFYSYHEVLDTMLHELCHNAHAPHNATFYKLWDQLRKECEELMAKGITGTGQGFDVPGKRLGGLSRQPPLSTLGVTAAKAAEKRVRASNLLPSGPQRLGGDSKIMSDLSPIQAAAMAAERRMLDEIWCGSQSIQVLEEEENVEPVSVRFGKRCSSWSDVIDLTQDTFEPRCTKRSCSTGQGPCSSNVEPNIMKSLETTGYNASESREESAMWECAECTLLNPVLAPICELCTASKPKENEMKHKVWSARLKTK